ncbi:MAG: hypothetical protein IIW54_04075 [Lachnospiraceae bacterium]|nr:hypothetical protein [Lachnospiraceae bacterium]MBQ5849983.1 hypothetical protein [Lachnospiraceae bacterium]MEE0920029.1 hypothetical protein [Lachnospiraceae bacterium]
MLNEERVKLMTKMASYEANEGKRNVSIGSYFRGDYIGLQVMKSVISATVAFVIVFALFVLYDFEVFMADIYKMDLMDFGKKVIIYYLVFVLIYAIISYIVYMTRYGEAKRSLKIYFNNLKKLSYLYDREVKRRD